MYSAVRKLLDHDKIYKHNLIFVIVLKFSKNTVLVTMFDDESWKFVFSQTPRDETLGGFHGRRRLGLSPTHGEKTAHVVVDKVMVFVHIHCIFVRL